ncbi:unnamed protein product [Diabrotica balteata]|uniref:Uncharacterized protein n=1 Tax=Diabrotica balteata TaxID=107213 RepID=A0A9N9TCP8_DIABA|nr:unnamed protein product [Diabrotica balteata]
MTYKSILKLDNFTINVLVDSRLAHTHRSDTCKICDVLDKKLKYVTLDENERKVLAAKKKLPKIKADLFFKELKEKTTLYKHSDIVEVVTFGLQQNLSLPKIPAGEAFYKRQLWTYNFCVHSGKKNQAHFYRISYNFSPN